MAKYSGLVGYATQYEATPGVWKNQVIQRPMKGEFVRQNANITNHDVHGDSILNHRISLVGDAFAFANYFDMKWVQVHGRKITVTGVEISRPRLIVSLGGEWNGD